MKKLLCWTVFFLLISGCATAPAPSNTTRSIQPLEKSSNNDNPYLADITSRLNLSNHIKELYFELKKTDNGWDISEKLNSYPAIPKKDAITVKLSSLEPVGQSLKTDRIDCAPIGDVCTLNNIKHTPGTDWFDKNRYLAKSFGPFYKSSANLGKTALLNTFGLFLSMGTTAGSYSAQYSFDYDGFYDALTEALEKNHITPELRKNLLEVNTRLLDTPPVLKISDNYPLLKSIRLGKTSKNQKFINAGEMINTQEQNNGFSPLMLAILENDLQSASLLIDAGAEVNLKDNNGNTAISYLNNKQVPLLKKLLITYKEPLAHAVS